MPGKELHVLSPSVSGSDMGPGDQVMSKYPKQKIHCSTIQKFLFLSVLHTYPDLYLYF